jgi:hypothetical protein
MTLYTIGLNILKRAVGDLYSFLFEMFLLHILVLKLTYRQPTKLCVNRYIFTVPIQKRLDPTLFRRSDIKPKIPYIHAHYKMIFQTAVCHTLAEPSGV